MPFRPHPLTVKSLWSAFVEGDQFALGKRVVRLALEGKHTVLRWQDDHPLADEWRDAALAAAKLYLSDSSGLVYAAANPAQKGWYKVGSTLWDADGRARALTTAGVIGSFEVVRELGVADRFWAEAEAHRVLADSHPRHKELFWCDYRQASAAVEQAAHRCESRLHAAGLLL